MDEIATPEVAVFAEILKLEMGKVLPAAMRKADGRPDVEVELVRMLDLIYAFLPGTTRAKDGTIGITYGMTRTEVSMAIVLEESKRMQSPVLYRRMYVNSLARLRKQTRNPEHIWYNCVLTKEKSGADYPDMVDVYLDATPILA